MTDNDLEQRLRNHYRSLDPSTAPRGLALRIEDGMTRPLSRWAFLGRMPAIATGIAAVAVVALVIVFRPGGLLAPVGASPSPETPTPTASATPHPSPAVSPGPSQSPSFAVPPVNTDPWVSLDLAPVSGNPQPGSVVAWSGGYLALESVVGTQNGIQAQAWVSRDGRSWRRLPDGTFGNVISIVAASTSDGIVVLATAPDGTGEAWRSTDGLTWTSSPAPAQRRIDTGYVAGGAGGVVVAVESQPASIERSTDGASWQTISMPTGDNVQVTGVAAFGAGFVAVGHEFSVPDAPVAWWSPDGVTWNPAQVPQHPGEKFLEVHAAAGGLVAMSETIDYVPGSATFWTSADGKSWQIGQDPLGTWQQGEGAGNPNGFFVGDGTRLLGYGITADNQPTEYWISLNATDWTQLTLTGDTSAATTGQVTPFLMRDGILFAGDGGAWFGGPPN